MNNEISPISGDVLVDKVLEESPVYTCNAVILFLDNNNGVNGDYYAGAEVAFENPVPVYDDNRKLIGCADLSVEGRAVEAKCFLNYHTPERLSIQSASEKIYPSITANEVLIKKDDDNWHVVYLLIEDVTLTRDAQSDKRILPL